MGRALALNISTQMNVILGFLFPKLRYFFLKNKDLSSLASIERGKEPLRNEKKASQPVLQPTFSEVPEFLSELPSPTPASTAWCFLDLEAVGPCGPEANLQAPSLPLTSRCVGRTGVRHGRDSAVS